MCPYCYARMPSRGGRARCDDCLRVIDRVTLTPGAVRCAGDLTVRIATLRNGIVLPPRHGFAHESFRHPDLARLRRTYKLDPIVAQPASEFARQLALRDWVCAAWTGDLPGLTDADRRSPLTHVGDILQTARQTGRTFYCTYKAIGAVELASAFGWTARLVNIMHHMLYEMWSNEFDKWFVCDAFYNTHFERDGVPLSAREIREAFHRDGGCGVRWIWGPGRHDLGPAPCRAFAWYVVYLHNNFFDFPPGGHLFPVLMPRDRFNRGKHWRQGAQIARRRGDKYICKGLVAEESDPLYLDYPINQTRLFLLRDREGLFTRFQHNMPNYGRLEVRMDSGRWQRFAACRAVELRWPLHERTNRLEARCVNTREVTGPASHVELEVS